MSLLLQHGISRSLPCVAKLPLLGRRKISRTTVRSVCELIPCCNPCRKNSRKPLTPTLIVFAVVLLAISYLIIQKDLREKARAKKWLEDTVKKLKDNIEENRRLIEARKRTGCGVSILSEKVGGTI